MFGRLTVILVRSILSACSVRGMVESLTSHAMAARRPLTGAPSRLMGSVGGTCERPMLSAPMFDGVQARCALRVVPLHRQRVVSS